MKKLHRWHQTRVGLLVFGLIELGLAYGVAGLAIDRGGPWWYLLALIFLIGGLQNLVKLIGKLIDGSQDRK